jgi:hypothetical protein
MGPDKPEKIFEKLATAYDASDRDANELVSGFARWNRGGVIDYISVSDYRCKRNRITQQDIREKSSPYSQKVVESWRSSRTAECVTSGVWEGESAFVRGSGLALENLERPLSPVTEVRWI